MLYQVIEKETLQNLAYKHKEQEIEQRRKLQELLEKERNILEETVS